ncbi:MAG TPA: hypothetical protein EYG85_04475 [Crocinitomix sp.]|nr:hypothetical protein [Crocinitomix sp.]
MASKITITFNEDLPIGAWLVLNTSSLLNFNENWVSLRSGNNQVTLATPSSVAGAATAVNFVNAFNTDYVGNPAWAGMELTISIIENVVVIEGLVNFTTWYVANQLWNEYTGWATTPIMYNVVCVVENVVVVDPTDPEIYDLNLDAPELLSFNIDIIDTHENDLPLVLENTQVESPKLIYRGADDRFQTLMTSELQFNMIVPNNIDGKFIHLFSGTEQRYKVQIVENTNSANQKLVWQGYLLPEQFSEPYKNGNFFVSFVATDGIGRLKGLYLSDAFYENEQTIAKILSEVLLLTGNEFEIVYAGAIKNAVANLKLQDLAIDTGCYLTSGKKKTAYFILEAIVKSLGCRLFQNNSRWFIVGINRFKDYEIIFERYDKNGLYLSPAKLGRAVLSAKYEAHPQISMLPKLHKMTVEWDFKDEPSITPRDLLYQDFNKENINVDIKHWKIQGSLMNTPFDPHPNIGDVVDNINNEHFFLVLTENSKYGYAVMLSSYYPLSIPEYLNYAKIHNLAVGVWWLGINGWVSDNANKYVELIEPLYVEGNYQGKKTIHFNFEFNAYLYTSFTNIDDVKPYRYELILNGNVICSNAIRGKIEYSFNGLNHLVIGKVDIKELPIFEDGMLQFRFYAPMPTENGGYGKSKKVIFNKLVFKPNKDIEPLVKVRDIDFTTEKDIKVFHGDDRINNSNNVVVISENYPFINIDIDVPGVDIKINTLDYNNYLQVYSGGGGGWQGTITYFELSQVDYEFLKSVDPILIMLKVGGVFQPITFDYSLTKSPTNIFPIKYYFRVVQTGNVSAAFNSTDELWVHKEASIEVIEDKQYLRDKWSRFESNEDVIRMNEVLARVYHDALKDNRFVMSGNVFGLKQPFDILRFNYLGEKDFMPVRLNLNLTEGMTEVFAIEQKQENVEDYVD